MIFKNDVHPYMKYNQITYEKGCIEHVNGFDLNIKSGILNVKGLIMYYN